MKLFSKIYSALLIILVLNSLAQAQSFGFGCLGLSGFFAGISKESYDAAGLNDFASMQLQSNQFVNSVKFERGTGYRIGANFVRAKFDQVFITAKGYYQFLKEENNITESAGPSLKTANNKFSMNHWGVAVDIGVKLFWILDWKVIEGGVNFYNGEFSFEYLKDNVSQSSAKFNLDKIQVGYHAGTGLIMHIVPDYISLEGTIGYSFLKLDSFNSVDNFGNLTKILNSVPGGGVNVTLQMNVGFPL